MKKHHKVYVDFYRDMDDCCRLSMLTEIKTDNPNMIHYTLESGKWDMVLYLKDVNTDILDKYCKEYKIEVVDDERGEWSYAILTVE